MKWKRSAYGVVWLQNLDGKSLFSECDSVLFEGFWNLDRRERESEREMESMAKSWLFLTFQTHLILNCYNRCSLFIW